jgi:hypothetical protein
MPAGIILIGRRTIISTSWRISMNPAKSYSNTRLGAENTVVEEVRNRVETVVADELLV